MIAYDGEGDEKDPDNLTKFIKNKLNLRTLTHRNRITYWQIMIRIILFLFAGIAGSSLVHTSLNQDNEKVKSIQPQDQNKINDLLKLLDDKEIGVRVNAEKELKKFIDSDIKAEYLAKQIEESDPEVKSRASEVLGFFNLGKAGNIIFELEDSIWISTANKSKMKKLSTLKYSNSYALSPDSRFMSYHCGSDYNNHIIDLDTNFDIQLPGLTISSAIKFSADNKKFYYYSNVSNGFFLFDLEKNKNEFSFNRKKGTFVPCERVVAGKIASIGVETARFFLNNRADKIIFEKNSKICQIGLDGKDEKVLAEGTTPVLSPDGSKIVFLSFIRADKKIEEPDKGGGNVSTHNYVASIMDSDGKNIKYLKDVPKDKFASDYIGGFSTDGKKVGFVHVDWSGRKSESILYIVDADGKNLTKITTNHELITNLKLDPVMTYLTAPQFSIDGTNLLFTLKPVNRIDGPKDQLSSLKEQIFFVNVKTKKILHIGDGISPSWISKTVD